MRFFPVVNLAPRLGQAKEFPILPDAALARICGAVNEYNDWKDWGDTPTGDRHMRDAIANVQSMINTVPPGFQKGAAQEISKYCPGADDLIGHLNVFQGTTVPANPTGEPVPSVDTSRTTPPPPPNTNPPVATGGRGPGYGAFKGQGYPSVATGQPGAGFNPPPSINPPYEPVPTGSEPEPQPTSQPQPPPPAAPMRPAVATEGAACYYVIGQGYSWGARPSGGETTGLNQSDCQAIQQGYNNVRGLPNVTSQGGQTAQNVTNPQPQQTTEGLFNPNAPMATERPPVATGGPGNCPEGQFWDGRQCRGSVAGGGGLLNQAMNFGPSGGGGMISPGGLDINPGSISATSFGGMGRRSMGRRSFPVVNL